MVKNGTATIIVYVLVGIVALTFIAVAGVLITFALGRGSTVSLEVIAIVVGLVGPTVASLVTMVLAANNATQLSNQTQLLDGHLSQHVEAAQKANAALAQESTNIGTANP